jgi:hypothetical protein
LEKGVVEGLLEVGDELEIASGVLAAFFVFAAGIEGIIVQPANKAKIHKQRQISLNFMFNLSTSKIGFIMK